MPTKKYKQKLIKHRVCVAARIISCVSFLVLAIIGVSSIARAMTLESVEHQNGIPTIWQVASLGNPETITVPITYWDQRQDNCQDPNRQFEWSECRLYAKGIVRNIVKDSLGADGLPVPTYTSQQDAWSAYHDVFTANVIGQDPVQPNDNFYRWFHETYDNNGKQLSKQYDRTVTFHRSGQNTYEYGSKGTFPLDDIDFSKDDSATSTGHNFHFTAHMQIPMKIAADGSEQFWFSGDDDVWVFLNGQLVLDLGGLHMDTEGSFTVNANGDVVATVHNVNDQKCRQEKISNPLLIGYDTYNSQLENSCPRTTQTTVINTGFKNGDVVNLDFFYAERSTTESNTRITISNMNWPISADSNVDGKIVAKTEETGSNLVEYQASVKNRDPQRELTLERLATYISDKSTYTQAGQTQTYESAGFLPLNIKTLSYTTTPDDPNSWQSVDISAPMNSESGFKLAQPITMSPAGKSGDTLYFKYVAETSPYTGEITNLTSFYTRLNGSAGVTYDYVTIPYTGKDGTEDNDPTYDLDIEYVIDFGNEAPDPSIKTPDAHHETLKDGDLYSVTSPAIDGFVPDRPVVSGTVDGKDIHVTVIYTKKPTDEKETHRLVIHYIYDDGTTAFEDHFEELEEGSSFAVTSPDKPGYTKDTEVVSGTMGGEDREFTVIYKKDRDPVVPPVGPTDPNDPSDEIPVVPVVPGDDDGLTYTGPLGETAFVPNTGVVSDFVAPIFEQYFAEVILSQGFVLVALLIFAGSFSTYFSLRRYLSLNMATNSTRNLAPKKVMPKHIANSQARKAKSTKTSRATKSVAKTTAARKTSSRTSKKQQFGITLLYRLVQRVVYRHHPILMAVNML